MLGNFNPIDSRRSDDSVLCLGLLAVGLSAVVSGFMLLLRTGLPTPPLSLLLGPALVAASLLPPLLWARVLWAGPLAIAGLFIGCGLAALGSIGFIVIWLTAAYTLYAAIVRVRRNGEEGPHRLWLWILLLACSGFLAAQIVAGSKYINFFADQLLLYGRTDGDVMFHGAITNAYRYFHFPSTGIDGLHLLRYHTAFNALAALIAGGSKLDAVLALIVVRAQILFPMMVFAAGWGGYVIGRLVLPDYRFGRLGIATAAAIVTLLLQSGSYGGLCALNDPLLTSGVLLTLIMPTVLANAVAPDENRRSGWILGVAAILLLCFAKISTGTVWCGFIGYLTLRVIGPKRAGFWIIAVASVVLFAVGYLLASDPGQSGAVWFGTPFFLEYGIRKGNYLMPVLLHIYLLVSLAGLLLIRDPAASRPRRVLIETLIAAAAVANLTGLVLQIPASDGVFFFFAIAWFCVPALVMLTAAIPERLRRARQVGRRVGWSLAAVAVVAMIVDAGIGTDDRFYVTTAGAALLHTGDLSYYARDKRRAWRSDTQRALAEHGAIGLWRLPPPVPVGSGLAATLAAAKHADPRTAAYIPPQSDYWNLVPDCDGRSLWTMAVAGVPLIDGYVPVQSACPQEFALTGYGTPPATRQELSDAEVCAKAVADGFSTVLRVEAVADRSRDRQLSCR